jgi:hypothetical protein
LPGYLNSGIINPQLKGENPMSTIHAAFRKAFHLCLRLRGKIEPEHVVTVIALLVTSRAESPIMMAFAYAVIGTVHTTSMWRAEARAKATTEIRDLKRREAEDEKRESALEAELKQDETLLHATRG